MKIPPAHGAMLGLAFAAAASSFPTAAFAVDEDAAQALMKKNGCTMCHAVDKDKMGPSFGKVAAKYKGKADAEDRMVKFISTKAKVKSASGAESEHKMIDSKDPKELKNLAQWILAR